MTDTKPTIEIRPELAELAKGMPGFVSPWYDWTYPTFVKLPKLPSPIQRPGNDAERLVNERIKSKELERRIDAQQDTITRLDDAIGKQVIELRDARDTIDQRDKEVDRLADVIAAQNNDLDARAADLGDSYADQYTMWFLAKGLVASLLTKIVLTDGEETKLRAELQQKLDILSGVNRRLDMVLQLNKNQAETIARLQIERDLAQAKLRVQASKMTLPQAVDILDEYDDGDDDDYTDAIQTLRAAFGTAETADQPDDYDSCDCDFCNGSLDS